ncbi:hypothetical protein PIROE2DRAFT_6080 [Piromyces sp. E2]|nr:hypothetical protein PIROE2DRAFT_6080 [Piromyces sp. E2]|eukprot:OUM66660.1 hypothetical protein PIROE2DRAFT_6080 [Piromyces sp. E2]
MYIKNSQSVTNIFEDISQKNIENSFNNIKFVQDINNKSSKRKEVSKIEKKNESKILKILYNYRLKNPGKVLPNIEVIFGRLVINTDEPNHNAQYYEELLRHYTPPKLEERNYDIESKPYSGTTHNETNGNDDTVNYKSKDDVNIKMKENTSSSSSFLQKKKLMKI